MEFFLTALWSALAAREGAQTPDFPARVAEIRSDFPRAGMSTNFVLGACVGGGTLQFGGCQFVSLP